MRLHAYFGAVLTCAWSHDKRYLISGGQDDLIAVWDVTRRSLVSRGVGHSSWITSAAFTTSPPSSSRRPSKEDHDEEPSPPSSPGSPTSNNAPQASSYRVATCAVDCKMLLWEFDPTTLGGDEDGDGGGGSPEPPLTRDSSSGGGGGGRSAPFLSVPSIGRCIARRCMCSRSLIADEAADDDGRHGRCPQGVDLPQEVVGRLKRYGCDDAIFRVCKQKSFIVVRYSRLHLAGSTRPRGART